MTTMHNRAIIATALLKDSSLHTRTNWPIYSTPVASTPFLQSGWRRSVGCKVYHTMWRWPPHNKRSEHLRSAQLIQFVLIRATNVRANQRTWHAPPRVGTSWRLWYQDVAPTCSPTDSKPYRKGILTKKQQNTKTLRSNTFLLFTPTLVNG